MTSGEYERRTDELFRKWKREPSKVELELADWLVKRFNCQVLWAAYQYERFDNVLVELTGKERIPFAYVELKEATCRLEDLRRKNDVPYFSFRAGKFDHLRKISQDAQYLAYLAVALTNSYGIIELTQLSRTELDFAIEYFRNPMKGWCWEENVHLPIHLFILEPRR